MGPIRMTMPRTSTSFLDSSTHPTLADRQSAKVESTTKGLDRAEVVVTAEGNNLVGRLGSQPPGVEINREPAFTQGGQAGGTGQAGARRLGTVKSPSRSGCEGVRSWR